MILSKDLGLIFIKTRKVAGTSFEIALSAFCGPKDIITPFGGREKWNAEDEALRWEQARRRPQNYMLVRQKFGPKAIVRRLTGKPLDRQFWEHMTAADIRERVDDQTWTQSLKVSVVRNPYDFAVSNYYWFKKWKGIDLTFLDFVTQERGRLLVNRTITEIDGQTPVDVMLRYETLQDDVKSLSQRLGLGTELSDRLSRVSAKGQHRSRGRSVAEEFEKAPSAREIVAELCAPEIERYGYAFPMDDPSGPT